MTPIPLPFPDFAALDYDDPTLTLPGTTAAEWQATVAAHGTDALVGALRRAVAFRRFRAVDVRSILAAGAGTPQPRPAGDALILDLPVAPTRSLDAYKVTPVADGGATS